MKGYIKKKKNADEDRTSGLVVDRLRKGKRNASQTLLVPIPIVSRLVTQRLFAQSSAGNWTS